MSSSFGRGGLFLRFQPKRCLSFLPPPSMEYRAAGQAQRRSVIRSIVLCGAPTITVLNFGAVPKATGQMVAVLKRDLQTPAWVK